MAKTDAETKPEMKRIDPAIKKRTIAIDFDGVIHQYSRGFQGLDNAYDPPMPGVRQSLGTLKSRGFRLVIVSSRPVEVIEEWLKKFKMFHFFEEITNTKLPAQYYIDDHAIRFDKNDEFAWEKTLSFIAWDRNKRR